MKTCPNGAVGTKLPQAGNAVLVVNGDAMAQLAGCGGIGGGCKVCVAGKSSCCAAASNVLLIIVIGSQPPPSQKLFAMPSEAIALATLFEICTGPQAGSKGRTFHT